MNDRPDYRTHRGRVAFLVLLFALPVCAQRAALGPEDRSLIEKHFRAAKSFEAAEEFDNAASEYRFILDKYPAAVPRVYHNLGLVFYHARDYEGAIGALERGLEL